VDIRDYLMVLKARKWTILMVLFLVVVSALAFALQQTPLYEARARVLVQPLPSGPQSTAPLQAVISDTESQLIASEPIASLVIEDLDLERTSVEGLLRTLTVQGITGTQVFSGAQILELVYVSDNPNQASEITNSFAENYIQYRAEQALATVVEARRSAQRKIQAASQQVTDITEDITNAHKAGDDALATTLELQRNVLLTRLGVLQQRMDDLQPNESIRSGSAQVIESATTPKSPSSPNYLKIGALSILLGVGLGVGLAFLRDRLDDRFSGKADVERATGVPVLATVPKFVPGKKKRSKDLVVITDPAGSASEAYRSLRTNLQFVATQRRLKSVLVTSPAAGEGKTVTTANLALALAQAGRRVVLISADLRRPTVEHYFGLSNEKGLSTGLLEEGDLRDCIQDPGVPNLRVISSGPVPMNPAELLASPRLVDWIRELESSCDLVLLDSPPILAVADAAIITRLVGGTVLVVDASSTHRSATMHAKQALEKAGGSIIGVVINALDPQQSSEGYYGYGSYYSSYGSMPSPDNGETDPVADKKKARRKISLRR
jgi:capsular exopolysaccharide synthesis family protein